MYATSIHSLYLHCCCSTIYTDSITTWTQEGRKMHFWKLILHIHYTFIEKHTLMYSTTRVHTSMDVQNSLSCCRRSFGKQKLVIPKQVTWKGWKFTYDNWSWRCHARRFQESKMVSGFHLLPCCDTDWRIFQSCFFQGIRRESVSWLASFILFKNRILCWNEALNFYNYMVWYSLIGKK